MIFVISEYVGFAGRFGTRFAGVLCTGGGVARTLNNSICGGVHRHRAGSAIKNGALFAAFGTYPQNPFFDQKTTPFRSSVFEWKMIM